MKEKIAIITYNTIGDGGYKNGMIETASKEIYIRQGTEDDQIKEGMKYSEERIEEKWDRNDKEIVGRILSNMRRKVGKNLIRETDINDMDKIYLYVGTGGGDALIKEFKEMSAEKITYVMCDCNYEIKKSAIEKFGHKESEIVMCECGGEKTLEKILKELCVHNNVN